MTIVEGGWNLWVRLVSVVSRKWVWLVGGIYGCGYQKVGVVRMYVYVPTTTSCELYNLQTGKADCFER